MPHQAYERNPFMMMINPEVVLAAVAKSERLGQLKRQLCRPLDKPAPPGNGAIPAPEADDQGDDEFIAHG